GQQGQALLPETVRPPQPRHRLRVRTHPRAERGPGAAPAQLRRDPGEAQPRGRLGGSPGPHEERQPRPGRGPVPDVLLPPSDGGGEGGGGAVSRTQSRRAAASGGGSGVDDAELTGVCVQALTRDPGSNVEPTSAIEKAPPRRRSQVLAKWLACLLGLVL